LKESIAVGTISGFIGFLTIMFFEGFEIETVVDTWLLFGITLGAASIVLRRCKYNDGLSAIKYEDA